MHFMMTIHGTWMRKIWARFALQPCTKLTSSFGKCICALVTFFVLCLYYFFMRYCRNNFLIKSCSLANSNVLVWLNKEHVLTLQNDLHSNQLPTATKFMHHDESYPHQRSAGIPVPSRNLGSTHVWSRIRYRLGFIWVPVSDSVPSCLLF